LKNYRSESGFGFSLPNGEKAESFDGIDLGEGYWHSLISNPQYQARKAENRGSYL
jgi:hypothetical protein